MTVFPVLCSAMLRHFLDSPLKHDVWCLWRDTNSFLHAVWSHSYMVSWVYMHILIMCVSVLLCMAWGVCIWACVGYVLGLQHLNWGVDTYAWLWYVVLAGRVIRWRKSSGETAILVFACVVSITVSPQAGGCLCIVQLGSVILCMLEFCCFVDWAWYYTYVVHHYLFIVVCVLYVTMPCRLELCNCNLFYPFFVPIQRKLLEQSIWRKQLLYLTLQYMPMYVLHVCLYVSLITLDRLVLPTPSVLCFSSERLHLGVYALIGLCMW